VEEQKTLLEGGASKIVASEIHRPVGSRAMVHYHQSLSAAVRKGAKHDKKGFDGVRLLRHCLVVLNAKVSRLDPGSMDRIGCPYRTRGHPMEDLMLFRAFVNQKNGVAFFPRFQRII
jgi:hypothetical protein